MCWPLADHEFAIVPYEGSYNFCYVFIAHISLFDSKTVGEKFSLFDPNVLEEISKMKEKNIVVEMLRKLMAEQIAIYKRTNVVQSQKFSEKIALLMNAYYNGLITNEEVIKELLKAAEEIAALHQQGEKLGLSQEELAFYDALTPSL